MSTVRSLPKPSVGALSGSNVGTRLEYLLGRASSPDRKKGHDLFLEIVRMGLTWGAMLALIAFWYWLMSNIGTF
jgi:hypothetical protein